MNKKIIRISLQLFSASNESKGKKLSENLVDFLVKYCSIESNLLEVYRLLRRIRYQIQINKKHFPGLYSQYNYLIDTIDTEIEIIKLKIDEPDLRIKIPKLLKWTDTQTALIELIYGIQNLSINFGKGKLDEITACFEFIFQIKLGNISEKFGDLYLRKSNKFYIDRVKDNLLQKLQK